VLAALFQGEMPVLSTSEIAVAVTSSDVFVGEMNY